MKPLAYDDWSWKLRVAFLFILGHMVILVLPFFSVIFLLMNILGEGTSNPGTLNFENLNRDIHFKALAEGLLLILLVVTFFSELITMFGKPFGKFVILEVILLFTFDFVSSDSHHHLQSPTAIKNINGFHLNVPLVIISLCTFVKVCCAFWSESVENAKLRLMRTKGTDKIV